MAEILGTVASGIGVAQLAGNLVSSIIKLKNYWDQIKDAPDDIGFLVREIDTHHLILRSILESQARMTSSGRPSDTFLEHSLKLCEDSSNELNELVKALGKEMKSSNKWRSKLGATKVVLKNDQLKRLKKRMKNASKVMNLAITWQTNATLQQQFPVFELKLQASLDQFLISHQKIVPAPPLSNPTTQVSTMNALVPLDNVTTVTQPQSSKCDSNSTSCSVPKDHTSTQISSQIYSLDWSIYLIGSIYVRKTQQKRKRNRFKETKAKYKPPAWLSNRAWQCMYTKDLSTLRCNIKIQTYRILDFESSFYKALVAGDIIGVQEMFANRTAFVNDRFAGPFNTMFWDDGTPLHIAASNAHLDLCKLLLAEGADISSEESIFGYTPLGEIVMLTQLKSYRFHPPLLDIVRILVEAGAYSELIDQTNLLAISASSSLELFQYLQQHTFMSSGEISFVHKVCIARCFLYTDSVQQSPNFMLSYLGGPSFQENITLHRDNRVVENFFVDVCREFLQDQFKNNGIDLIKKMTSAGMSLHTLDKYHETALQTILAEIFNDFGYNERKPYGLISWLECLVKLGVDLDVYGEIESPLYKKRRMAQNFDLYLTQELQYVLGFKYGPRIEDWELWLIEPTDEYAGDFWKVVENPLQVEQRNKCEEDFWKLFENPDQVILENLSIPGAWVD